MDEVSVFTPIITALEAIPGIIGKVTHAQALKNTVPPFVFWLQTVEGEKEDLSGYTGLLTSAMELHVVAKNLSSLDSVSKAVRNAVIGFYGATSNLFLYEQITIRLASPVLHEKEVGMFRKVYDVTINYQELPPDSPENNQED